MNKKSVIPDIYESVKPTLIIQSAPLLPKPGIYEYKQITFLKARELINTNVYINNCTHDGIRVFSMSPCNTFTVNHQCEMVLVLDILRSTDKPLTHHDVGYQLITRLKPAFDIEGTLKSIYIA